MATKAWAAQQSRSADEIFFQNDAVSLCLLVNRRARTMRVIDFRAGLTMAKRLFVLSLAQREGVDKVYTLVERDEAATWGKLGFQKEGNIPGFYKRSDAFLLGCRVDTSLKGGRAKVLGGEQPTSEIRLATSKPIVDETEVGMSPAQARAERTVVQAKKLAKDLGPRGPTSVRLSKVTEADIRKAVGAALRSGRALTAFEPFGRDVERRYFLASARSGAEVVAAAQAQACFGNVFLEILQSPRTEAERAATNATIAALCDELTAEGVVSCFSLAPSDDLSLATAHAHNGFRRTGLLSSHLVVGSERKDAILWSRKLANPTAD